MKSYENMLIKKDNIMPLIEKLSKAYNNVEDDYVVINTKELTFILFGEMERWIKLN